MSLQGQCLCGGVTYHVSGELPTFDGKIPLPVVCHCKMCQKQTGGAFLAGNMVRLSQFAISKGSELLTRYESSLGTFRSFCSHCGSMMFFEVTNEPGQIYISLGTIDNFTIKPRAHIFMSSKAAWYDVNDDLPKFDEYPT